MNGLEQTAKCLYCREPSHLPRLAYLVVALVMIFAAGAAAIEGFGFRTLIDFGHYPHGVRVFVIICTIVYLPLLVAIPEFGRSLYFDENDRTLILVRQGILLRRAAVYPLDSIESLSVRNVTRMRGNVTEVGLHMVDGYEAYLFSYRHDDEESARALSEIVNATGLQVLP